MDTQILLLLFLFKNPEINDIENLLANLQRVLLDECPWHEINNLGQDLNSLTEYGLLDERGKITSKGSAVLQTSRTLCFISTAMEELIPLTKI
jgi:hypothetical protein